MALSAEQVRHTENVFHIALRRGETHEEHYAVRERELQWRSRWSKRDIPNVLQSALRGTSTSSFSHFCEPYGAASVALMWFCCVLSLILVLTQEQLKGRVDTDTSPQNF